jgi:hypothetical protein
LAGLGILPHMVQRCLDLSFPKGSDSDVLTGAGFSSTLREWIPRATFQHPGKLARISLTVPRSPGGVQPCMSGLSLF